MLAPATGSEMPAELWKWWGGKTASDKEDSEDYWQLGLILFNKFDPIPHRTVFLSLWGLLGFIPNPMSWIVNINRCCSPAAPGTLQPAAAQPQPSQYEYTNRSPGTSCVWVVSSPNIINTTRDIVYRLLEMELEPLTPAGENIRPGKNIWEPFLWFYSSDFSIEQGKL